MNCTSYVFVCPLVIGCKYDYGIDMWSVGAKLYELYFSQNQFKLSTQHKYTCTSTCIRKCNKNWG